MNGIFLLVGFSLVAITVVVIVLNRLGRSKVSAVADKAEAGALIHAQLPGDSIRELDLANNGEAALALMDDRTNLALLRAAGSKWTVRQIRSGEVRNVGVVNKRLRIQFSDFADPKADLTFEFADSAGKWAAIAEQLKRTSH